MFGRGEIHSDKPVQLYHLDLEGVTCRRMAPAPSLDADIHYYWVLDVRVEHTDLPVIPDNAVDLVLSPDDPGFAALYFSGAQKYEIAINGPVTYAGVCFPMERAVRFFHRPLAELKHIEHGAATARALGISRLLERMRGLREAGGIARVFNDFFESYPRGESAHDRYDALLDATRLQLRTLTERAGLSERQLRRVTARLYGMGPKKIQRIFRLQAVLRELFSADPALLADGYYDDSHMIKELKKLTGLTPGEIRRMAENYNHKQP